MTKDEVKQEFKGQEASAEVRGARKRRQMEGARARMMAGRPRGRRRRHEPDALRRRAEVRRRQARARSSSPRARTSSPSRSATSPRQNGVPVVPDPPLARSLHASVEVGHMIPEELYQAVAQLLAFVYRTAGRRRRARRHPDPGRRLTP